MRAGGAAGRAEPECADIVDVMVDGRGVARPGGKTVLVRDAIAGETVRFVRRRRRRSYDEAELIEVLRPSAARATPPCDYFGTCGGCALQHLAPAEQIRLKQGALLDNLHRIGDTEPERILEPLADKPLGYRRKARLAVKHVPKKGRVLVGFRERDKPYVTNMDHCHTLHPAIGERLAELSELIGQLGIRDRLPQIEAAVGDDATALVFRVLDAPSATDRERLARFQHESGVRVFLQPAGPDSIYALDAATGPARLHYRLPEFGIEIGFTATDFVQVHAAVNRRMVAQAVELLAPAKDARILDLFCGLGNFTLPLARAAGRVIGLEHAPDMVARARDNAMRNDIDNAEFHVLDLGDDAERLSTLAGGCDRVLLDPPRTGAREALAAIAKHRPERMLYVSCHPGTLARDAGYLVHDCGYRLAAAGIMDMFPHTAHVESMALFESK